MLLLQLLPVILSLLLLAAHFMRYGQTILVVLSVVMIGLLVVRRPWAARILQVVLLLACAEWIRTLVILAGIRAEHGQSAGRMVVILAVVALITAASALVFRRRRASAHFRIALPDGFPVS